MCRLSCLACNITYIFDELAEKASLNYTPLHKRISEASPVIQPETCGNNVTDANSEDFEGTAHGLSCLIPW